MEIRVNIPTNDYVQPTEIRENVVQGICEAFLSENCWSIFHPHHDGIGRNRHRCIIKHKGEKRFYGFINADCNFQYDESVRFNGAEMKAAFDALIKAGYYMFKVYEYGTWMGYVCKKKPYYERGSRVDSFDDFID